MTLTDRSSVIGGDRGSLGYRGLAVGPGEPHRSRTELLPAGRDWLVAEAEPLLTVAHLSDIHLCDTQSPARGEFLDRWSDPDSPLREVIGIIGSYRAQDCLTLQVGAAAVDAINKVGTGPVGGADIDWAITTGDVVDSAQANEMGWYVNLLEGGRIVPDSGSPDRYEGVADHDWWDEAYWHPDPAFHADGSPRPDRPRRLFGYPDAAGLLDALRRPFDAPGLAMPWLAVHGNHDQLVQGNIPGVGDFAAAPMAGAKAVGLPADWAASDIAAFCGAIDSSEQRGGLELWPQMQFRTVTPDAARRTITRAEFVAAHFGTTARPIGHGFGSANSSRCYYRYDHGSVTVLVLDAVNEHGGWQGSLDEPQLIWLDTELTDADRERRYVVIASHHRLADLVNGRTAPGAARRVLADEVSGLVSRHPSLVLWLNGHTHITQVEPHRTADGAWWEVTTPSLIDFPQQGRIVELLRSAGGVITVAVTMVDHTGELPWSGRIGSVDEMAGLSRELAANDWQFRPDDLADHPLTGTALDRNALLHLPDPWA